MSLIVEHSSKNKDYIINTLNNDGGEYNKHGLFVLTSYGHCSKKWLNLILFKILENIPSDQVKIDKTALIKSYLYLQHISNGAESHLSMADMIAKYAKMTDQEITQQDKDDFADSFWK